MESPIVVFNSKNNADSYLLRGPQILEKKTLPPYPPHSDVRVILRRWSASGSQRRLIPTITSKTRTEIDFSLEQEVGQGSYGCVYQAHEKKSQEILAIKRIARNYVDEFVEQECLSLAKCCCNHIIQFEEVFLLVKRVPHSLRDKVLFTGLEVCF